MGAIRPTANAPARSWLSFAISSPTCPGLRGRRTARGVRASVGGEGGEGGVVGEARAAELEPLVRVIAEGKEASELVHQRGVHRDAEREPCLPQPGNAGELALDDAA